MIDELNNDEMSCLAKCYYPCTWVLIEPHSPLESFPFRGYFFFRNEFNNLPAVTAINADMTTLTYISFRANGQGGPTLAYYKFPGSVISDSVSGGYRTTYYAYTWTMSNTYKKNLYVWTQPAATYVGDINDMQNWDTNCTSFEIEIGT